MCPERSVMMSLISDLPGDCWKTGVGRVAVDFGAGQGAKRSADIRSDLGQASNAGQRQNQRNPGGHEAEGQLAASLVRSSPLRGCALLAPCHPPFCLYARPIPVFQQSPIWRTQRVRGGGEEEGPRCVLVDFLTVTEPGAF